VGSMSPWGITAMIIAYLISNPQFNIWNISYINSQCVGSFNVSQLFKGCETGPPAYSPYLRRLESLNICWCNYKGSTLYSVILRLWVLVRPESNSRPTASQPDAQPTEPPVRLSGTWVSRPVLVTLLFGW